MELRQTEEKVNELITLYEHIKPKTTPLVVALETTNENSNTTTTTTTTASEIQSTNDKTDSPTVVVVEMLSQLQTIQSSIERLRPKMDRFRKRLAETDPITGNPRYGTQTATRVKVLLEQYDGLQQEMEQETTTTVMTTLQQTVEQLEQETLRQQEHERRIQQEAAQAIQREQEEQERQSRLQQQEQEALRQRELQELNRRAQESRRIRQEQEAAQVNAEQRARAEQHQQDQAWMNSIPKGPQGVQQQLDKLREATTKDVNDATTHRTALGALHTLFSQIVSHPEETKFRRVRRDHPKFNQDIGCHEGGKEVLIAAGFRLGAIDDVPCFISTEPSIEHDMDGWSDWFNLLKATLEIIEQELDKK